MSGGQPARAKMPIIAYGITASDCTALRITLYEVLSALSIHPLMAKTPSSHLTPPPLFHIYDFVQRTCSNLAQISVDDLAINDKDALQVWNDCAARCAMARLMIQDKNGKAAELLGGWIDFGEGVRETVARAAIVSGKAGTAEEGAVGEVNAKLNGTQRGIRSGGKK